MAMKVLWLDETSAPFARTLPAPEGVEVRYLGEKEDGLADWPHVIVSGAPAEEYLAGANLRSVVVPYAGIGNSLKEGASARPQLSVHNSHYNAKMVAQHATALLLACANRVVATDQALRRGDWGSDVDEGVLGTHLEGKVGLLVGYGAIGKAVQPILEALGMEVRAYRRRPDANSPIKEYGEGELVEALTKADAVIVSLPGTDATAGLLNEGALAALKESAILVNVGRGSVIVEEALFSALQAGRLGAAGIDVWYRYPGDRDAERVFPGNYPFQELRNVVMTPHSANDVRNWRLFAARDVMLTLAALAQGEERNTVDLAYGY